MKQEGNFCIFNQPTERPFGGCALLRSVLLVFCDLRNRPRVWWIYLLLSTERTTANERQLPKHQRFTSADTPNSRFAWGASNAFWPMGGSHPWPWGSQLHPGRGRRDLWVVRGWVWLLQVGNNAPRSTSMRSSIVRKRARCLLGHPLVFHRVPLKFFMAGIQPSQLQPHAWSQILLYTDTHCSALLPPTLLIPPLCTNPGCRGGESRAGQTGR